MQVKAKKEKAPKKRGRRLVKILIGLFVLFVVAGVGMVGFTSSPSFCKSCHQMKPYFESWQASTHSEVSCIQCHFAPGIEPVITGKLNGVIQLIKTITNTASPKPHAEVEDVSCLRGGCHVEEDLSGAIKYAGKYNFDHTPHLKATSSHTKLRCATCHAHETDGAHMEVSEEVCFICHFKGRGGVTSLQPLGGCTACHEEPKEPITLADGSSFLHADFVGRGVQCLKCHLDAVAGNGEVSRQACLQCHSESDKLAKHSEVANLHEWHITKRKVDCLACHSEIRHGLNVEGSDRDGSCQKCHETLVSPVASMFAGVGASGIEEAVSMHRRAGVECVACHQTPAHAGVGYAMGVVDHGANEAACIACHGEGVEGTLGAWRETIGECLAEVREELARTKKELSSAQLEESLAGKADELLKAAEFNLCFVEEGRGIHNPDYAMAAIDKAADDTEEARRILEESAKGAAAPETNGS